MNRSARSFGIGILFALGTACSAPPSSHDSSRQDDFASRSGEGDDLGALFGVSSSAIGVAVPSCSTAANTGFVATTGVFTLTLAANTTTEVVIAPVGNTLRVNGFTCVDTTGTPIDLTKVSKVVVNGTNGDDAVVLDFYLGTFSSKTTGAGGGGVVFALGAGTMDRVGIRGTSGADAITAGSNAGRALIDFTGDGVADALWSSTATRRELMLASAGGNDALSGSGRSAAAPSVPISATAALAGAAVAAGSVGTLTNAFRLSAYGGPGNDRLQGGDGDDLLDGGEGDDLFLTAASRDGADVYLGGPGTDTLDYSARTQPLTVTIALTATANANDGESGESDDVTSTVENVTGGSGNDVITGSGSSNILRGGPGNDVLNGGPAGSSCATDVDQLFGDAGDDTFEMNGSSDCGDEVTGGAGHDAVTYHDRGAALVISGDGVANDGEANEKDNVRADVEIVVGGQGNDTITGSATALQMFGCAGDDIISGSPLDDTLSGGPGNDTLNGLAGNDTFLESGDEPRCVSPTRGITVSSRGLGSDVINGGVGVEDTVDYLARTANLTITLCVDNAAATGVGTCGAPRNDGEAGELDAVLNIEVVEGGSGNDVITGSAADEWLNGNGGNDTLDGQGGNDQLDGGVGTNTLTGGNGADVCRSYSQANACDLHVYTCNTGTRRDCDRMPENACETDTATSLENCGACGTVCANVANGTRACTNGTCGVGACNAGYADCDAAPANGCETNTLSDAANCGACGTVCSSGNVCSRGQCVVPSRTTWALGNAMPVACAQNVAVNGKDGFIYLFGGYNGPTLFADSWKYEIATGRYTAIAPMPWAVRGACGDRLNDGRIVVTGGYPSAGTWIYNPSTNAWTTGAGYANGWECAAVTRQDGSFWVFGGESNRYGVGVYSATTNAWSAGPAMAAARYSHGASLLNDGSVLVFGGDLALMGSARLNSAGTQWSVDASLPTPGSQQFAWASDGRSVYVLGGSTAYGNNTPPYHNYVWYYESSTSTWRSDTTTLPQAARESAAVYVDGRLYVFGGFASNALGTLQIGTVTPY